MTENHSIWSYNYKDTLRIIENSHWWQKQNSWAIKAIFGVAQGHDDEFNRLLHNACPDGLSWVPLKELWPYERWPLAQAQSCEELSGDETVEIINQDGTRRQTRAAELAGECCVFGPAVVVTGDGFVKALRAGRPFLVKGQGWVFRPNQGDDASWLWGVLSALLWRHRQKSHKAGSPVVVTDWWLDSQKVPNLPQKVRYQFLRVVRRMRQCLLMSNVSYWRWREAVVMCLFKLWEQIQKDINWGTVRLIPLGEALDQSSDTVVSEASQPVSLFKQQYVQDWQWLVSQDIPSFVSAALGIQSTDWLRTKEDLPKDSSLWYIPKIPLAQQDEVIAQVKAYRQVKRELKRNALGPKRLYQNTIMAFYDLLNTFERSATSQTKAAQSLEELNVQ